MSYFKFEASCSNCKYADLYIPYWTYPYSDPFCRLGHGKCDVNKCCNDFKLIGRLCR